MNHVRVLLAEDSPEDAKLTSHVLYQQGLLSSELKWVEDGEEAIQFLQDNPEASAGLKLVLLDLKMPKIDGLEVLRYLRSQPCTLHLPVVIWSSSGEDQDVWKSYDLGSNSYVVKPIEYQEFSHTLEAMAQYWLHVNQLPRSVKIN